jgi:cysteine synthase A
MIKKKITDLIGNTPMVQIDTPEGMIHAKLETTNPTGSIKDRMAWYMIRKAEERGELKPGSKIIEVTSGNTGIAFSMICAIRGYDFIAVMPDSMSEERRNLMKGFGATIILSNGHEDMIGAVRKYNQVVKENPDAWLPKQFENPDNIEAYRHGLAKEIDEQMNEKIDVFVAAIGTGGTLLGVGKTLKEKYPDMKIIGVEPVESAVLNGEKPGLHKIQGIGEGFIPKLVEENRDIIDEVIKIKSDDSIEMSKKLSKEHGLLVGISSGANVLAAMKLKEKYNNIVTILPDRGERYLSSISE